MELIPDPRESIPSVLLYSILLPISLNHIIYILVSSAREIYQYSFVAVERFRQFRSVGDSVGTFQCGNYSFNP